MEEGELLGMNGRERRRLVEMEAVRQGKQSLGEAAKRLGLSYRQGGVGSGGAMSRTRAAGSGASGSRPDG